MSVTREQVEAMIEQYATSVGLTKEQIFNPEKRAYYWTMGSAKIEVFVQSLTLGDGRIRNYLRLFSPLMQVPKALELQYYRHLLELNDTQLGVKLSVMKGSDWVYATYERDINGIDYEEVATCIADLEWWADKLDDELKLQFAGAGSRPDTN